MSIADEATEYDDLLAELAGPPTYCTVGAVLIGLPDKLRATAIDRLAGTRMSPSAEDHGAALFRLAERYDVSLDADQITGQTVNRHRRGRCKCPQGMGQWASTTTN